LAATTQAPAPTAQEPPKFVNRKVGPLMCRFVADRALPDDKRPADVKPIPTVQSIAEVAFQQLMRPEYGVPRTVDEQVKYMIAPVRSRAWCEAAVKLEHLRTPKGDPYTKSQLAPLVTLVRKAYVPMVREWGKREKAESRRRDREHRKAQRAREAAEAKQKREQERAKAKLIADAAKAAKVAVLPQDAKPSKAVTKDKNKSQLRCGHLSREGSQWQLLTTDSYQVCVFPLTVHGDAGLVEGLIPYEALVAIEKGRGFRIEKGQVVPLAYRTGYRTVNSPGGAYWGQADVPVAESLSSVRFELDTKTQPLRVNDTGRKDRPRKGQKPALEMRPRPAARNRLALTFDAELMQAIAKAIGAPKDQVTLEFDLAAFSRADDGSREWAVAPTSKNGQRVSPAIRVTGKPRTTFVTGKRITLPAPRGFVMPARTDA
jgi:hypothetical protein